MRTYFVAACILTVMLGCRSTVSSRIPLEADLLAASSNNGKYNATIERYDADEMIAIVNTPGWRPEDKHYRFDGKKWIPLWSPYELQEMKTIEK